MLPTRRAAVVFFITLSELVSSRGDPPELKHPVRQHLFLRHHEIYLSSQVHGHVIPDAWPTIKRAESAPKRVAVRRARLVFILHAATDAREILPVLEVGYDVVSLVSRSHYLGVVTYVAPLSCFFLLTIAFPLSSSLPTVAVMIAMTVIPINSKPPCTHS